MFGWKVEPSFDVPEGLQIREDTDFVYLYDLATETALYVYRHNVSVATIKADIKIWERRKKTA